MHARLGETENEKFAWNLSLVYDDGSFDAFEEVCAGLRKIL